MEKGRRRKVCEIRAWIFNVGKIDLAWRREGGRWEEGGGENFIQWGETMDGNKLIRFPINSFGYIERPLMLQPANPVRPVPPNG